MPWASLTDVRCYYETPGEGPPLLLIPGLGGTCRLWDPVVPELARHFSLVLVDNRGVGRSEPKRPAGTIPHLVSDLVELLDFLGLETAHVMGVSLGGIIAQRMAIDHPSRVDRLVLVSCTDSYSPYLTQMAGLLGQTLRHFPKEVFHRTLELLGTAPEHLDATIEEVELRIKERGRGGVSARAVGQQLRCVANSKIEPQHYRISAPTLVMAGEFDAIIPRCYARRMAEKIPGSRFIAIPDSGHNPLAESPERALPPIIRFLNGENDPTESTDRPAEHGRTFQNAREALLMR